MTAAPIHPVSGSLVPAWGRPLVDARTGVVRRLAPRPLPAHFPPSFTVISSWTADSTRFGPWPSDSAGAGYGFDRTRAAAAAVGEAVERYCSGLVPPGLHTATRANLLAAGRRALGRHDLALFSPDQYREAGFPFVPLDDDLALAWADGRDAVDGSRVAVPACLVWSSYPHVAPQGTVLAPIQQAGLAAGRDLATATRSAVLEILERDAMVMSWTARAGVRRLEVPGWLDRLAAGPSGALRTRFLHLGTGESLAEQVGISVIAAAVHDDTTGYLALGSAAGTDPQATALKALGEALQLQLLLADYDDPDGALARAATHPGSPLRPWRADRAYTRSYRPDLRDVHDYGCHLQLHLDPAAQHRFESELVDAVTGAVTLDDLTSVAWSQHPPGAGASDAAGDAAPDPLSAALADRGHRPVVVDLTTEDIRPVGLRVVRVLVPGLYGNAPAGRPFLGGRRLPEHLSRHGLGHRVLPLPH